MSCMQPRPKWIASIAFLSMIVPFHVFGEDLEWSQFRGPNANPSVASDGLPSKWSSTVNVEWSAEIPGRGWSSPIVTGGKVFITTVTTDGESKPPQRGIDFSNEYIAELMKDGHSEQEAIARVTARDIELPEEVALQYLLICLDLASGDEIWKQELHSGRPPGGRHRKNSFASETPVTDGTMVYVYISNLGVFAYDLDGEQKWKTPLDSHPVFLNWGTGSSPILHEELLLIANDNQEHSFIAALNKETGKRIWKTRRTAQSGVSKAPVSGWATPFVWKNNVRTEIVTLGPGTATSYSLTGKEIWRLNGMSASPVPTPFAHEELLYVDGGKTRPVFAIKPGGTGDITPESDDELGEHVAWTANRAGSYIPTPVAYGGGLYVLNDKGILTRYDAKTGSQNYRKRLSKRACEFTSSPWAYNGRVFCLSEEGDTYVVRAGSKFELLCVNPLKDMSMASPAIVGDRLLIRTEKRLYSLRDEG